MPSSCPKGKIRRKAYTRKDGTHVKSTCVPDKGKPGKTPASKKVLPKPQPGSLSKYGYSNVKNTAAKVRRAALLKAVKDAGYATIVRRVNLVANYNKLSDPKVHKIMRSDIAWMQKVLAPEYSKTARRVSRKASRKVSRKGSRKVSRKGSRKASRKGRKASRRASRKVSRKASRKASRKSKLVKAGTKKVAGRSRQLYHVSGSTKKFYQYRKADGGLGRRYV